MTSFKLNSKRTRNTISSEKPQICDTQDDITDLYEWLQDEDNLSGCSVLFLKKYGEINSQFKLLRSDFCVIVATNKRKVLMERGLRTLCVDTIPWSRSDEFSITVLFAMDNEGMENTIGFMFSDRSDAYIYEVFFTKLKKYFDGAQPEMLLTPVSQGVFTAFKNVMKNEVTKSVFSPWQVDEFWRNQLKVIKQADKRKEVYKTLRGLHVESDREEFDELYSEFLAGIKINSVCTHVSVSA